MNHKKEMLNSISKERVPHPVKKRFHLVFLFYFLLFALFVPLFFIGCQVPKNSPPPEKLKLLSWNVQNLFDGEKNGIEYPEFDPEKGVWNETLYQIRLENFSMILNEINLTQPLDIILLIEIENRFVLDDLSERLEIEYPYKTLFEGGSYTVRTAIISKYPIEKSIIHEVGYLGNIPLRPVLEAQLRFPSSKREERVSILLNHWKSRSGGARETEIHRQKGAEVVRKRIEELENESAQQKEFAWNIVVAGDLNENWNESLLYPDEATALSLSSCKWGCLELTTEGSEVRKGKLFTPWPSSGFAGSYIFQERWNSLDHFLLNEALFDGVGYEFNLFQVIQNESLFWDDGTINSWQSYYLDGFSDHLPLLLELAYSSSL